VREGELERNVSLAAARIVLEMSCRAIAANVRAGKLPFSGRPEKLPTLEVAQYNLLGGSRGAIVERCSIGVCAMWRLGSKWKRIGPDAYDSRIEAARERLGELMRLGTWRSLKTRAGADGTGATRFSIELVGEIFIRWGQSCR